MQNNNNHSNDFDLFQEQNDYSNKILEEAKILKKGIQEFYSVIEFKKTEIKDSWLFDFDVNINQVAEQIEPGSIKLFTRQYTPIMRVYQNSEYKGNIEFDKSETKIINKYINELFVGESVSQEEFFDIAKQYFLLDFTYRQLNDENSDIFVQRVKTQFSEYNKSESTIISVNCKLRGRYNLKTANPNLHSAICHINRLWDNLSSQSKFIIIGNYRNYSRENELISQLNNQNLGIFTETISNYFQNDFLLLNNMEFMDENPYTWEWNEFIFSPLLLEKKEGKYYLKKDVSTHEINKEIFLFQKIIPDGIFYKTEIYIPKKDVNQVDFIQIILLSQELLKLKHREEK